MTSFSELISLFLPIVVMILFTVISKRVLGPIVLSTVLACFFEGGLAFPLNLLRGLYAVFRGEAFSFILVLLLSFGALIHLIKETDGIKAFRRILEIRIKSQKMALLFTWLLGLSLFMDDYLNSLIVGTTMKHSSARFGIPRVKIALMAIMTGIPICLLFPLSSWAVFLKTVLEGMDFFKTTGYPVEHGRIVPYMIYPFFAMGGSFLHALGILPDLGPLRNGKIKEEYAVEDNDLNKGRLGNFLIPLLSLVSVTMVTVDIIAGTITSLVVSFLWFRLTGQLNLKELVILSLKGMGSLVKTLLVILFALTFGHILMEQGFALVFFDLLSPYLKGGYIPLFSFLITSLIVFGGLDIWAVMPLLFPVFIPLSQKYGLNPYLIVGSVLSGISLGAQLCFISESHILISETLDLKPIEQIRIVFPYSLIYALLSGAVYLVLGFRLV